MPHVVFLLLLTVAMNRESKQNKHLNTGEGLPRGWFSFLMQLHLLAIIIIMIDTNRFAVIVTLVISFSPISKA